MTFEKAEKKIKKIAKGQYHSVGYERTYHDDGSVEQECSLYIDGGSRHEGRTWENAFKSLEVKSQKYKLEKAPKGDIK